MIWSEKGAARAADRAEKEGLASRDSRRHRARRLGFAIGLWAIGAATSASAHTASVLLPPAGDYRVRWYQPHAVRPVDNWQIEVVPQRNPSAKFTANVRMSSDSSCWGLNVPVGKPAKVRIRSVAGAQVSAWSVPTNVPSSSGNLIRWYQSSSVRVVDNWDIEVTVRFSSGPYIVTAQVMPNAECWALAVPINEPANVRIRSVTGSQTSAWSMPTAVPEPGIGVGTVVAGGLLSVLARRKR